MKVISKQTTRKLLAGLLLLTMFCGIWPTFMTAKAATEAVAYGSSSAHAQPHIITYFTLSGAPAHTGGTVEHYATEGGIYVNGEKVISHFFRETETRGFFNWKVNGFDAGVPDGAIVKIDGTFKGQGTNNEFTLKGNFIYKGGKWYAYNDELECSITTDPNRYSRLPFFTTGTDSVLPNGEHFRVYGGMYVKYSGEAEFALDPSFFINHYAGSAYYLYSNQSFKTAPAVGTEVYVDGIFGSATGAATRLTSPIWVWDGTKWNVKPEIQDSMVVPYNAEQFAGYRENLSAPTEDGYVFAGWYADEECETALKANTVEDTAYAKFVNAKVLTAKAQVTANIDGQTQAADIRFVTTVDSLDYKEVGFYITIGDADQGKKSSKKVYSSLYIVGKDSTEVDTEITPDEFCNASEYFATFSYWNVGRAYFDTEFTVTPYWVTLDGTTVEGAPIVRTVNGVSATYNQ